MREDGYYWVRIKYNERGIINYNGWQLAEWFDNTGVWNIIGYEPDVSYLIGEIDERRIVRYNYEKELGNALKSS